jgi:hypothetical protein
MTDTNAPVTKHMATAKEHAAGVKAARQWIQDLSAAGLLDSQHPVKDEPIVRTEEK